MLWVILSTGLIYIFYFVLISAFYIGWRRISPFFPKGDELIHTKITVIVACRNEELHIRQIISCLAQQSYQYFEVIFINDHSEDATRNYIKSAQESSPNIKLIDASGFGKKNAIKEGVLNSTSDLIVTTDADCMPSIHWLESIMCFYKRYPSDLIICPVKVSGTDNLFSYLQMLEFASLVASTAGSTGIGMPVMCNGANLVFTKKSWLESEKDLHLEVMSGDDMFLLESIKRRKGLIRFLKSESAIVITETSKTWMDFFKQRRRWTSKSTSYTDFQIIITASIVLIINLLSLTLLLLSFINQSFLFIYLLFFLFKYMIDTIFLYSVRNFFQLNNIWAYSILLSVLYPFYIVFIAFSTFFFKPNRW